MILCGLDFEEDSAGWYRRVMFKGYGATLRVLKPRGGVPFCTATLTAAATLGQSKQRVPITLTASVNGLDHRPEPPLFRLLCALFYFHGALDLLSEPDVLTL